MNRIILLRHGENPANLTKEFSCQKVDYPLTEKGKLQAQQAAEALRGRDIRAIYTSPLKRAQETAAYSGKILGLTPMIDPDFQEFNVGRLEDVPPTAETWGEYHQVIQAWVAGHLDVHFPGGENNLEVWARYERGLRNAIKAYPDQTLLIVGHGGIFTTTLPTLCPEVKPADLFDMENHNASLSEIDIEIQNGKLIGHLIDWANISHLSGEAAELVSGIALQDD